MILGDAKTAKYVVLQMVANIPKEHYVPLRDLTLRHNKTVTGRQRGFASSS